MRTVILHGHIFKNAGTTFDWSLQRNFGDDFCDHREDMEMRKGGPAYLQKYLLEHGHLKALSSHHLNFKPAAPAGCQFISCYFLRNPVSRVHSVYQFERQQKSDSLGAKTAKLLSFLEYSLWRMRDDIPNTIRNYQTAYLSGSQKGKPGLYVNYPQYELARKLIENNPFIGVVDRYEESMIVIEEAFARCGIAIDLSYRIQNVMDTSQRSEDQKMCEVLDELGTEANYIFSKNIYDYRLYRDANILLTERVAKIERFDEKCASFRSRCVSL